MRTSFNMSRNETMPQTAAQNGQNPSAANAPVVSGKPEPETLVVCGSTLEGDFGQEDMLLPSLKLIHPTSELSEQFTAGSFVLNDELLLSDGTAPINLTVLTFRKLYRENIPYTSDEKPRVCSTAEEVEALGGVIGWNKNSTAPRFAAMAELSVLIEGTPDSPLFPYDFEGKAYGLGHFVLRKSAYNEAGRAVVTVAKTALRDGLYVAEWELISKRIKVGGNPIFVPHLRLSRKHSEAFIRFVQELMP